MDKKKLAPIALALPLSMAAAAPAYGAAQDTWTFQGNLSSLNDSGTTGSAWVQVDGNQAHIKLDVSGAVEGQPHAQHIHIGGEGVCPGADADENGDGIVSTPEGQPSYGAIKTTLTTEGDTSPDSALVIDRMPTGGSYTYERTVEVSDEMAQNMSDGMASVVVHGIDTNGNGEYDDSAGSSPLDESLPLEATAPAACGELSAAPEGGMQTGNGGAADEDVNAGLLGLGGAFAAAAAGGLFLTRRIRRNS